MIGRSEVCGFRWGNVVTDRPKTTNVPARQNRTKSDLRYERYWISDKNEAESLASIDTDVDPKY
jgi:hypothetical protein